MVAVHALKWLPRMNSGTLNPVLARVFQSGQYGVQLFFIVSAVTLFNSNDRRRDKTEYLGKFFLRRLARVAPLYWFGIALYGADWYWHGKLTAGMVLLNALFLHPYSRSAFISIPRGGWSIGVEMQFYILLPLLFWWVRGQRQALILLCAALALCFVTYAMLVEKNLPHGEQSFAYYWMPNQLPIFAMGIVCYAFLGSSILRPMDSAEAPSSALLLSMLLIMVVAAVRIASPLYHLAAGFAFAVFVVALGRSPWKGIVNRPMVWLGRMSYSIYILHFAVLSLIVEISNRLGLHIPATVNLFLLWFTALAVTAPMAWITNRYIELPGIAFGRRLTNRLDHRRRLSVAESQR